MNSVGRGNHGNSPVSDVLRILLPLWPIRLNQLSMGNRNSGVVHCFSAKRSRAFPSPSHETKTSSWLPPVESWDSGGTGLPYGWETALDKEGKTYFINHVNRTTTNEDPRKDVEDEPPQPREVELFRDPHKGFGFVAGSEKPVIVRFVTEGGPSENKLLPGDQILQICEEDVSKAPREHVIELVRSCKQSVKLTVCQPVTNNTTRKSALLTAAKKAKLKSNPSRVRFAEGVVVNGSPLYYPSPFESCIPFMPNVLKVYLENSQTKSFKYDSTTTVQDVLNALQEKLSIKCIEHFSLVVEHIKSLRKNKLSLLDPKDTLAKIAARPGAHHLRCLFRMTFVPKDAYELAQKDPVAFDYLFVQCCNDVIKEKFAPELKYDIALRLAALNIQQHALDSGLQGKMTVKTIERECGLDKFVPSSLLDTMKRKELLKLLSQLLKQNQALSTPGQKQMTSLQARLHYLKIISELPSYGAKCFSMNLTNSSTETALLVGPRVGISQISTIRNIAPVTLSSIENMSTVEVTRDDDFSYRVSIYLKNIEKESLNFSMEDKEAEEFVLLLERYYSILVGNELDVRWEGRMQSPVETVPTYHSRHTVRESPWSYPPTTMHDKEVDVMHTVDLAVPPPPYVPCEERQLSRSTSREQCTSTNTSSVDHNMNEMQAMVITARHTSSSSTATNTSPSRLENNSCATISGCCGEDVLTAKLQQQECQTTGIDFHSVVSIEMLESGTDDVDLTQLEAKSEQVISRVTEMGKIVSDAEEYLLSDRNKEQEEEPEVSKSKSTDSLLILARRTGRVTRTVDEINTPTSDILPSESDNESLGTPTSSPSHCPLSSTSANHSTRTGSSFGLHSPNVFGLDQNSESVMELLQQLNTNSELPFGEGTFYLDPDLIDLTMIPPPIDTEMDHPDASTSLHQPPVTFLDQRFLSGGIDSQNIMSHISHSRNTGPDGGVDKGTVPNLLKVADSTRVVSELDALCDALSYLQTNKAQNTSWHEASAEDIDSVIATFESPIPLGHKVEDYHSSEDDIFAYIIPPPPSSVQTMEEQNEVIERFRQAADDIRRMMGCATTNAEKCEEFCAKSDECLETSSTLNPLCNFSASLNPSLWPQDVQKTTEAQPSAISELLLSGTTKPGTTLSNPTDSSSNVPEIKDSLLCKNSSECTAATLPSNCPPPTPVKPNNLVSTVPSTKTDDGWKPQPPPRLKKLNSMSIENLNSENGPNPVKITKDLKQIRGPISRSFSLTSLKGPLRPTSEQPMSLLSQSKLLEETSTTKDNSVGETDCDPHTSSSAILPNGHHYSSSLQQKAAHLGVTLRRRKEYRTNGNPSRIVNGYSGDSVNNNLNGSISEETSLPNINTVFTKSSTDSRSRSDLPNGSVCTGTGDVFSHHLSLPRKRTLPKSNLDIEASSKQIGIIKDNLGVNSRENNGPFLNAHQEISAMVLHLEEVGQKCLKTCVTLDVDVKKFISVKDTLMLESRQFVTASKLFVKSTTESSDKMEENLTACLALLDRIFSTSELVVMHMSSASQITCLIEHLKEMALEYSQTVQSAYSAKGDIPNPNMGGLMHQATSLATSLTTLMRTLRTFSNP